MDSRKLIAHGPSSLTIALPHRWIKKHALRKGDLVAVQDDEVGLHITAKPTTLAKHISVSLSEHDWPAILTVLTTVYRRGYDEVRVRFSTPQEYQLISNAVRSLLGFAIVEHSKGRCTIQSLPPDPTQDFQILFRRVFLILLSQLEDLCEVLDDPASLRTFYQRDADLNAIVNLSIRMINKGYIQDRFQELHLFHTLLILEECGDDITRFTIEAQACKEPKKDAKNNGAKKRDEEKQLKAAVRVAEKMVRMLYDAYFSKKGSIMEFYKQYYLYWPDAPRPHAVPAYDFLSKAGKGKPVFYLRSIVEKVIQLAEILLLPEAVAEV